MAITIKQIEAALNASGGFQSTAAKKLGVSRAAISQRIKKHPALQKALKEIIERRLDLTESALISLIQDKHYPSIQFYLKCHGKDRGYIEKTQLDVTHDLKGGVLKVPGLIEESEWDEAAKINETTEHPK